MQTLTSVPMGSWKISVLESLLVHLRRRVIALRLVVYWALVMVLGLSNGPTLIYVTEEAQTDCGPGKAHCLTLRVRR